MRKSSFSQVVIRGESNRHVAETLTRGRNNRHVEQLALNKHSPCLLRRRFPGFYLGTQLSMLGSHGRNSMHPEEDTGEL